MTKKYLPYIPVLAFAILAAFFFQPLVLGNKTLFQNDKLQWRGGSMEVAKFRESEGEEPLWTNSMFGGMPAYLVSTKHFGELHKIPIKMINQVLPPPAGHMFLGMLCFYVMLLSMRVDPIISGIGSIAFAFTSFTIVSMEAGHNSKVLAMNLMPLLIAGMNLVFRKKYLSGAAVASLAAALLVGSGHYQIAYYSVIIGLLFFGFKAYPYIKEKDWKTLGIVGGIFIGVGILGLLPNMGKLLTVQEYSKYSNRARSELVNDKVQNKEKDRGYAFAWSYGKQETLSIIIPNASGGGSSSEYPFKSMETFDMLKRGYGKNAAEQYTISLMYWGPLPSTGGGIYFGAIIVFFFILGLAYLPRQTAWFLGVTAGIGIMLSWGKNFSVVNNLLFDILPGYDKFRTPMMALSIAQFIFPLGAALFLSKMMENEDPGAIIKEKKFWRVAGGYFGFLILIFLLAQGFSFTGGPQDDSLSQQNPTLFEAMISDRKSLFQKDWIRTLFFTAAGMGVLLLWAMKKTSREISLGILGLLVLADLWTLDKRFLNSDNFIKEKIEEQFSQTPADRMILQDQDPNYRVLNLAVNTFNDATTSFWHKSIGGYHGTKMRRYQDLIERHIGRGNQQVLNMLNTRYVITRDQENPVQRNPGALGNAWFVSTIKGVEGPNAEMEELGDFKPRTEAIIDETNFSVDKRNYDLSGSESIVLSSYKPHHLVYETKNDKDGFAVFSEIYYPEGWTVSIDQQEAEMVRVNWVLRGLEIPSGEHTVEFKFKPSSYYTGNQIGLTGSVLIYLLFAVTIFMEFKKKRSDEQEDTGAGAAS